MGAKKKPQDTLSLGDLGVDAGSVGDSGSQTEVYALAQPPARGDSRKIEDDGNAAEQIVEFLAEKRLV
jgi:electron transfer flavoprotein beta subunit